MITRQLPFIWGLGFSGPHHAFPVPLLRSCSVHPSLGLPFGGPALVTGVSPGAADKCEHDSGREESATFSFSHHFSLLLQNKYNDRNDPDKKKWTDRSYRCCYTNACTRFGREHARNTHNHCRFLQVYTHNMQMQYPIHNKEKYPGPFSLHVVSNSFF